MRTLVLGIPLPHSTFDNYSFLSAPSISEYKRLVVEMSSVSRVVEEVARGTGEHRNAAGQLVVNGPPDASQFALSRLLAMRRGEAERFFSRGGVAVCIACPDATFTGIADLEDWRLYDWLPEVDGFSWHRDLQPGFGREAAEPAPDIPIFARYVQEFAPHFRYKTYAEDDAIARAGGDIIARSAGGMAIAFEIALGEGRIVFIPPLHDPAPLRQAAAEALLEGFDQISAQQPADVPEWIRKEVP